MSDMYGSIAKGTAEIEVPIKPREIQARYDNRFNIHHCPVACTVAPLFGVEEEQVEVGLYGGIYVRFGPDWERVKLEMDDDSKREYDNMLFHRNLKGFTARFTATWEGFKEVSE